MDFRLFFSKGKHFVQVPFILLLGAVLFYAVAKVKRFYVPFPKRWPTLMAPSRQKAKKVIYAPYANSIMRLCAEFPIEWRKEECFKENVRTVKLTPPVPLSQGNDNSDYNLILIVEKLNSLMSLFEYKELWKANVTETYSSFPFINKFHFTSDKAHIFAGQDGWEFVYSQRATYNGKQRDVRTCSVLTVFADQTFCIQYTSTKDHAKYRDIFEHVLKSIKVV